MTRYVIFIVLWQLLGHAALGEDAPFLGTLKPGPHAVGFRSTWMLDAARIYDYGFAYEDGRERIGPRPVLVNLWYPAARSGEPMPYGGYLEVLPDDPSDSKDLDVLAGAYRDYARRVVCWQAMGIDLDEATAEQLAGLEDVLATPTIATRDAEAANSDEHAEGRFPVVLYHAGFGSSIDDNAVLCEYLASHGYVVLSSAYFRGEGGSFNVDAREASADDLMLLVRTAADLPFVDAARIAMIGHSGGAHATLYFAGETGNPLKVAVCLDTTQDYHPLENPLWDPMVERALDRREALDMPLLFVAEPHAIFVLADRLVHAERAYLTVPGIHHDQFISQGVLLADDAGSARRGYDVVCRGVRAFLDAHVRGTPDALHEMRATLDSQPSGPSLQLLPVGPSHVPEYREGAGPPSPRQLRAILAEQGADAVTRLLEQHAGSGAAVLAKGHAFALLYELHAREDDRGFERVWKFYKTIHPDLFRSFVAQAELFDRLEAGGRRLEYAKTCCLIALRLDPQHEQAAAILDRLRSR